MSGLEQSGFDRSSFEQSKSVSTYKVGGYTAATTTILENFKIPCFDDDESTEWFIIHVFYMTFLSQMSLILRFSNLHAATSSTFLLPSSFGTGSAGDSHLRSPVDFVTQFLAVAADLNSTLQHSKTLPVCIASGTFPMQHYMLWFSASFLASQFDAATEYPFRGLDHRRTNGTTNLAWSPLLCLGDHSPARESLEHVSWVSAPAVLEVSLFSREFHGKEAERAPTVPFPTLHTLHCRLPIVVTLFHACFLPHSSFLSPRLNDHSAYANLVLLPI
ncbi:hypothetical protein C8R45DRAFT_1111765 [Mycena sanguinolenta]|nr:hypothetical protein C8R45DRAFT_1111765 [Mycena sanguinolenta]